MTHDSETALHPHPSLTPFDLELLRLLARDFLLLSRRQICQLFPGRSLRNINYRLRKLIQAGLVSRRLYPTAYPGPRLPLYYLGPKAPEALSLDPGDPQMLSRRKRALQLRDGAIPHFLLVNSVHIKFLTGSREYPDYELLSWIHQDDALWLTLNDYGFPLRPDGYAEFRKENYTVRFFLELDRGTERGRVIGRKLAEYHQYVTSGRFEQHFAAPRFRVLFIATTSRRARELLRHMAPYPSDLFWAAPADHFFTRSLFETYWSLRDSDISHSLATPL